MVLLGVLGAIGGTVLAAALHAQTILFVALGGILPVLKLLATPQHIDAWRSRAAGEREVGARPASSPCTIDEYPAGAPTSTT